MFKIGDKIVYDNSEIYTVETIGKLDTSALQGDRTYYTLAPYYKNSGKIFTPVDNQKVSIRAVISREEAMNLIEQIPQIEILWIDDEKKRERIYKEAFCKHECSELVRIIKTIYLRKELRLSDGKKLTSSDELYFRKAEESLYGELAVALDMDISEVKDYIVSHVKEKD